jgi:hypothetical protein
MVLLLNLKIKVMKKQDMIKQIQQTEASMFLQCKQDEHTFGEDSSIYKTSRAQWNGVYELMNELGIKPDYTLDEHNQIVELINMKYRSVGDVEI